MLKIKPAGQGDSYQEYYLFSQIPQNENGFKNEFFGISYDQYLNDGLNILQKRSLGMGLSESQVPTTYYILWLNKQPIGLFICHHHLNAILKDGSGHVSFSILKKYRNKGYATEGLRLLIKEVKDVVLENEIYMSCNKSNQASLKVQLKNGANIYHQDKYFIYTKIPVRKNF